MQSPSRTESDVSARRVRRAPLGDLIAARLRQEILLGVRPAGSPVPQQELTATYRTSRVPVRDALIRLAQEGLIMQGQSAHAVVAELTYDDIADSFDIEALMQGRAAYRATLRSADAEIDGLAEIQAEMVGATKDADLARLGELSSHFHRQLAGLAKSYRLLAYIRNVSVGIPRTYFIEIPEWSSWAAEAHGEIVDAMRARDPDRAESLVRRLIEKSGADLVKHLRARNVFAESTRAPDQSSSPLPNPGAA
jgi:DNA-binding GntR family transcriptional regulator